MQEKDIVEHSHGLRTHRHAWGSVSHNHLLRAVCNRPECRGAETHNIHRGSEIDDLEALIDEWEINDPTIRKRIDVALERREKEREVSNDGLPE